jgi:hypothetical protein
MQTLPKAARTFNLAVAALVFCMMLAFAAWVVVSELDQARPELARTAGGAMMAGAALVLLASVRREWRSGEPMQHERGFQLAMALFGIGATVLVL